MLFYYKWCIRLRNVTTTYKLTILETLSLVLNGRYKVYIDPYAKQQIQYYVVGYKGTSPYDGIFYCIRSTKWFVQLVRTLSNRKSVSKLVTVLHKTHSQRLQQSCQVQTTIHTTDEFKSQTLCNNKKRLKSELRGGFYSPFFYVHYK